MQKLETRNGTLYFSESPETTPLSYYYNDGFDIIGEVTNEGITFDCEPFLWKPNGYAIIYENNYFPFIKQMSHNNIKLREGYKFIVLKEK